MKKLIVLLLSLALMLALAACGAKEPTTAGSKPTGSQPNVAVPTDPSDPTGGVQQNPTEPTKPNDGLVDPEDPSLSDYEKEFYQVFNTGHIVRFDMEDLAFDISFCEKENSLLVVLHRRENGSRLPTEEGTIEGNFVSDIQLLYRASFDAAADGTITCKLQEHKLVMKRSGDYTDEVAEKYLAYLAGQIGQNTTQEQYDYIHDMLMGEAMEDTMYMDGEQYLSITAKQNGGSYTDIRIDAYDGEELACYFLVLEDMVQQIMEDDDYSRTTAYSYAGQKLYEEYHEGEECARADYIYNNAGQLIRMEVTQNGEKIATEEYTYDAAGNKLCVMRYQKGILIGKVEYNAEGEEVTVLEYDENGNITYGYESIFDDAGKLTQKIHYWGNGGREIRKYDENGREISNANYDAEGVFQGGFEYVYDGAGNKVQETYRNQNGAYYVETFNVKGETTSWMDYNAEGKLTSGQEYTYDDEGNVLKEVHYQGEERRETTRDKDGNVLSYYRYYKDEPMEWQLNTYNEAGQILSTVEYGEKYNGEIGFNGKLLYFYNEKGLLVRLEDYYYEDSETPDAVETYTYDADGNQLCNYRYNQDGSLWGWNEYTYNADGKPLTWIHYRGEGTSKVERREEWKYNANGECIQNLSYNAKGEIIMGFINEYDENGKLVGQTEYYTDSYEVTRYESDTYGTRHVYNRENNELEYWVELIIEGDTIVDEIWHFPE